MDFKELIQTGDDFAQIAFLYSGTPEAGMLAWLDGCEMKTWWRADNAIVEPYPGGMFYITWAEADESSRHAICGSMDVVDVENQHITVSKIYYMAPAGKLGPLHLDIRFEGIANGETRIRLRHTHRHRGQLQKLYNASVYASWPKTFALLKNYLENSCPVV